MGIKGLRGDETAGPYPLGTSCVTGSGHRAFKGLSPHGLMSAPGDTYWTVAAALFHRRTWGESCDWPRSHRPRVADFNWEPRGEDSQSLGLSEQVEF